MVFYFSVGVILDFIELRLVLASLLQLFLGAILLGLKSGRCVSYVCLTVCSPLPAGVWATKLGDMAGVKVPLIAMHHAYVVTERIEGIQVRPSHM